MGSSDSDSDRGGSGRRNRRDRKRRERSRSSDRRRGSRKSSHRRRDRSSSSSRSSRSTSRTRERRSERKRSKSPQKSSMVKSQIAATKEKTRLALQKATNSLEETSLKSTGFKVKQEDIDNIESAGFEQQSFTSSRGNKTIKTEPTGVSLASGSHDAAMFGTVAQKPIVPSSVGETKPQPLANLGKSGSEPLNLLFPIAHESLFEDPEVRQQRWINKWLSLRRQFLNSQAVSATGS